MEQHFFEHFVPLLVTCTIGCLPQRTLESNGFIITSIMRKSESTTYLDRKWALLQRKHCLTRDDLK